MFNTKKIVTLNLLLASVVGTNFGSEAPKSAWTKGVSAAVKEKHAQIFSTLESLVATLRPVYESNGMLKDDHIESVRIFTKNPEMSHSEAINFILSMHPKSPALKSPRIISPSRFSPATVLTPRETATMSPSQFTLTDSVSPDTITKQ